MRVVLAYVSRWNIGQSIVVERPALDEQASLPAPSRYAPAALGSTGPTKQRRRHVHAVTRDTGWLLSASTSAAATDGLSRLYHSGNAAADSGREMANPCTASHPIVRSHAAISSDSTPSTITLICIAWPRLQIPRRRSDLRWRSSIP